jgi:hypothetical protein
MGGGGKSKIGSENRLRRRKMRFREQKRQLESDADNSCVFFMC